MNINKEQIDDLNIVVSVQIGTEDYEPKVSEILRDYRRKANMPGFRPGKVPEGLVRKMYGKAVLIDEINKLVSETMQNYIKEQELQLLGDPMPKAKADDLDWEIGNDFTFGFEIGLAPAIEVQLSKEDQLAKYQIIVERDMIDKEVEQYTKRFGQFSETDSVVDFGEQLAGDIVQLGDDGQPLENGLSAEETKFTLMTIKNEDHKKPFENAKAGDEIVFNLSEIFPNEWEVASILKKKDKADVGDISGSLFRFTVKSVRKFVDAEMNQELFDKVFGEGAVSSVEEFESRIEANIAANYEDSCVAKLANDTREFLMAKINPTLPEEHLRKWLLFANKEISEADFEREFPLFLKNMKWELIVKALAKQHELNIDENEIIAFAKENARQQFAMYYGMSAVPDETLTQFAMNSLKDEKRVREIASHALERKAILKVSEIADLNIQKISFDDFNKMVYASDNEEVGKIGEVEEAGEAEKVEEVAVEEVKEAPVQEVKKSKRTKAK
jgi:trigger factor